MNEAMTRRFRRACQIICGVGILNLVVFVAIACYLGGDAVNGKIEGGRYYLFGVRSEAGRKVYAEVSESVFYYSRWHVYSLLGHVATANGCRVCGKWKASRRRLTSRY